MFGCHVSPSFGQVTVGFGNGFAGHVAAGGRAGDGKGEETGVETLEAEQLCPSIVLVLGPTAPQPVVSAEPEETMSRADCQPFSAVSVSEPK